MMQDAGGRDLKTCLNTVSSLIRWFGREPDLSYPSWSAITYTSGPRRKSVLINSQHRYLMRMLLELNYSYYTIITL